MENHKSYLSRSTTDLTEFADQVIAAWEHPVLVVQGEMGAGKTTFAKALCQQLGVIDEVSSPTFSLVNEYVTKSGETVYHFDFYRISDEEEAEAMGFQHYLDRENKCIIEWAENVEALLPGALHIVHITKIASGRQFQLKTIAP